MRTRNEEIRRKGIASRNEVIDRLNQADPMYVSIVRMTSSHATAVLRFHDAECPFLGFGVNCCFIIRVRGQLLRSGPHKFRVFENKTTQSNRHEEWHIESEDGAFKIVAEEIWLVKEFSLQQSIAETRKRSKARRDRL